MKKQEGNDRLYRLYNANYSINEIAGRMGIEYNQVRSIVRRRREVEGVERWPYRNNAAMQKHMQARMKRDGCRIKCGPGTSCGHDIVVVHKAGFDGKGGMSIMPVSLPRIRFLERGA